MPRISHTVLGAGLGLRLAFRGEPGMSSVQAESIDLQLRRVFQRTDGDYLIELVQRLGDAACFVRSTHLPTERTVLVPTLQRICDGYRDVAEEEVPHWRDSAGLPPAEGQVEVAPSGDP